MTTIQGNENVESTFGCSFLIIEIVMQSYLPKKQAFWSLFKEKKDFVNDWLIPVGFGQNYFNQRSCDNRVKIETTIDFCHGVPKGHSFVDASMVLLESLKASQK